MPRGREERTSKKMKQAFLVFCEGFTEECNGTKICSNPCIELWFLLHSHEQKSSLSSNECVKTLLNSGEWSKYKKGMLSPTQKNLLWNNRSVAMERAKTLVEGKNPSTCVYKLLDAVEQSLSGI